MLNFFRVLRFVLKSPARWTVLPRLRNRVWNLIFFYKVMADRELAKIWARENAQNFEDFLNKCDEALLKELEDYRQVRNKRVEDCKIRFPDSIGSGYLSSGSHDELIFLAVRAIRPQLALESGVAAGFSTFAILSGLEKNGMGHLYSSDSPYPTKKNSEMKIGMMVSEGLKTRWSLYIQGDRKNLSRIGKEISGTIDFVHYDSDKSYSGRLRWWNTLQPLLKSEFIFIFDDIEDNTMFKNLVAQKKYKFFVIGYREKYLGIVMNNIDLEKFTEKFNYIR